MGWFKKTRSTTERFPAERLAALVTVVGLGAASEAESQGVDFGALLATKWFAGYLLGYPDYLDGVDERLGGVVRKMLFDGIYGSAEGPDAFRHALGCLLQDDPQAVRGRGTGMADGNTYFAALEEGANASGATQGLKAMLEIGLIDLEQRLR